MSLSLGSSLKSIPNVDNLVKHQGADVGLAAGEDGGLDGLRT